MNSIPLKVCDLDFNKAHGMKILWCITNKTKIGKTMIWGENVRFK